MGSGSTKHEENVVADTVDKSRITTRDFTILRLHGDTGALIAGSLATLLLLYTIYRAVLWRRARLARAKEDAEQGPQVNGMGMGRFMPRAVPPPCPVHPLCNDCAERPHIPPVYQQQQPDVLQGHFQPAQ